MPVYFIGGFKNQCLTDIIFSTCALDHVVGIVLFPDLRIAHMAGQVRRIIAVAEQFFFAAKMDSVFGCDEYGICLTTGVDIIKISIFQFDISGVVKIHCTVFEEGRSGIYTVAVKWLIRVEGYAFVFPVDQIGAGVMTPHFHTAFGVKWGVLEKCVEHTIHLTKTVRIVEPANRRHQVQFLAELCAGCLFFCCLVLFSCIY